MIIPYMFVYWPQNVIWKSIYPIYILSPYFIPQNTPIWFSFVTSCFGEFRRSAKSINRIGKLKGMPETSVYIFYENCQKISTTKAKNWIYWNLKFRVVFLSSSLECELSLASWDDCIFLVPKSVYQLWLIKCRRVKKVARTWLCCIGFYA